MISWERKVGERGGRGLSMAAEGSEGSCLDELLTEVIQ